MKFYFTYPAKNMRFLFLIMKEGQWAYLLYVLWIQTKLMESPAFTNQTA